VEIDDEVANNDKHHRSVRVNAKGRGDGITDPESRLPFIETAQKQPTTEQGPKKKSYISARVLAKPDVMVGNSK
jgi:hypothetical protein